MGETETRFLLLFSVVGEIEGPKNAISAPRSAEIETLDIEVFMTGHEKILVYEKIGSQKSFGSKNKGPTKICVQKNFVSQKKLCPKKV